MTKKVINAIKPGLVVLVTAGASGIGSFISKAFLDHGCHVHICDIDKKAISRFLTENPTASASVTDVSNRQMVETLFADVMKRYSRLDVLVNNAGVSGPTAAFETIKPEEWENTIAVNLSGQFYCSQLAIPLLRSVGGGSIINIASSAALFGCPNRAPYVASKWAVVGLTKTLAMELGGEEIRVNAICPGSTQGPRIEEVIQRDARERGRSAEEIRSLYTSQTSLKRFIEPEEIAHMAVMLASDLGRSISGQTLSIDGHTESLSNALG
ncbi:MAG: SDR family oxidoreductase [Gammaproteobacteria bacterium]|nr:SDR family oxidoreductase [Gammaproteobacteria bacterium]